MILDRRLSTTVIPDPRSSELAERKLGSASARGHDNRESGQQQRANTGGESMHQASCRNRGDCAGSFSASAAGADFQDPLPTRSQNRTQSPPRESAQEPKPPWSHRVAARWGNAPLQAKGLCLQPPQLSPRNAAI